MHESCIGVDIVNLDKRKMVTEIQNELIEFDIVQLENMIHRLSKMPSLKLEESKTFSQYQINITHTSGEESKEVYENSMIKDRKSYAKDLNVILEESHSTLLGSKADVAFDKNNFRDLLLSKLKQQYPNSIQQETTSKNPNKMLLGSPAMAPYGSMKSYVKKPHPKYVMK